MKKLFTLFILISLLLNVASKPGNVFGWENTCNKGYKKFSLPDYSIQNSFLAADERVGFKIRIADNFEYVERFSQIDNITEWDKILYRRSVISEQFFLDIDVWLKNDRDFVGWLNSKKDSYNYKYQKEYISSDYADFAISINIDDYPSLLLSIDVGEYFIEFRQKFTYDLEDYFAFTNMIKTIAFDERENFIKPNIDKIVGELLDHFYFNEKAIQSGSIVISANNCCGLTSINNPFPCCSSDSSKGNCTWHVYYMFGYVPFTGDAKLWNGQVAGTPGWLNSNSPAYGYRNIGWQSGGSMGHVSFINRYYYGITGSEQSWCLSGCPSYFYNRPVSYYESYIYRADDYKDPPQ